MILIRRNYNPTRIRRNDISDRHSERDVPNETFFLGVDESNHGRIPEIIVATSSIQKSCGFMGRTIPKAKSWKTGIEDLLERGFDFRFVAIYERATARGLYNPKMRADTIAALIEGFTPDPFYSLELYIDGQFPRILEQEIDKSLRMRKIRRPSKLIYESKADITHLIVNAADQIARVLYRLHARNGEEGIKPYADRRILI